MFSSCCKPKLANTHSTKEEIMDEKSPVHDSVEISEMLLAKDIFRENMSKVSGRLPQALDATKQDIAYTRSQTLGEKRVVIVETEINIRHLKQLKAEVSILRGDSSKIKALKRSKQQNPRAFKPE